MWIFFKHQERFLLLIKNENPCVILTISCLPTDVYSDSQTKKHRRNDITGASLIWSSAKGMGQSRTNRSLICTADSERCKYSFLLVLNLQISPARKEFKISPTPKSLWEFLPIKVLHGAQYINVCFQVKASKIIQICHSSFICRYHKERVLWLLFSSLWVNFRLKFCLRSVLNQSEAKLTHRFPRMIPAACLVLMNSPSC